MAEIVWGFIRPVKMYAAPPRLSLRPESVDSVTSAPKPPVATLTKTYSNTRFVIKLTNQVGPFNKVS